MNEELIYNHLIYFVSRKIKQNKLDLQDMAGFNLGYLSTEELQKAVQGLMDLYKAEKEKNRESKERLKKVKKYIESEMDIVDNPTICGDEEDTIIKLPISLCLYNEDLRKLLELLEEGE